MQASHNLFRLIDFDERYLSPVMARYSSSKSRRARSFTLGELLEAYFWLALGCELGYFNYEESELLARQKFSELFSESESLFQDYGYLFAPEFETRLMSARNRSRMILARVEGQDFTKHRRILHSWFRHALDLEIESLSDRRLITLFAALSFLTPPEFDSILDTERDKTIRVLFSPFNRREALNSFRTSIQHIESFAWLSQATRESSDTVPEDGLLFRSRIDQLTRWRLNMRNPTAIKYYPKIAELFFHDMNDSLGMSFSAFTIAFNRTVADWGFTHHSNVRTAGGS